MQKIITLGGFAPIHKAKVLKEQKGQVLQLKDSGAKFGQPPQH